MVSTTILRPSVQLEKEIDRLQKKIQETFSFPLTKIQATKIIAWKSRSYNLKLTEKKLLEILGEKG